MKTFLKMVGAVVFVLAAGAGIFYIGWLRPPARQEVCDNYVRIALDEAKKKNHGASDELVAKASEGIRKKCMAWPEPSMGIMPWVKKLKCIRDAPDKAALDQCGRRGR